MEQRLKSHSGKIAEYALLLFFLGVLSITALKALGISIFNLSHSMNQKLETNTTLSLLQAPSSSAKPVVPSKSNGYYKLVIDPDSGKPALKMVDTKGDAVNVTSVDGQFNALGSFQLANYLDTLAEQETEPAYKDYYAQMAKLAYYMGANESEIDDFDTYCLQNSYSNGDALQNLLAQKSALEELMLNPPPGLNATDLSGVLPIASEVFNIAQNYSVRFSDFVGPDGKVTSNFATVNATGKTAKGLGSSTQEGTTAEPAKAMFSMKNKTYEDVVPYNKLKAQVKTTLSRANLPDTLIVTDLKDAVKIDSIASPE